MLKKALLAIAAVALLAVSASAVPPVPLPCHSTDGFIAQAEIPVCILIDKYAEITILGDCLELFEKPDEYWEGSTMVNITNNWSVVVTATIEPYYPTIVKNHPFECLIEGDPDGFGETSQITLHPYPYPDGYTFRLWAGIQSPNLLARASNPEPQRVATIYLTVQN